MPKKYDIAKCSRGLLGIITCDSPQDVMYPDGTEGKAWTGRHITGENWGHFGDPWSSRDPEIVGNLWDVVPELLE